MKKITKTLGALALSISMIACEESVDLNGASQSKLLNMGNVQTTDQRINGTIVNPERANMKVELFEAKLNKSNEIALGIRHMDEKAVQYSLDISQCTESIPAECEAKLSATSLLGFEKKSEVEKELRFDAKKYQARNINVLNIYDSFGNKKLVKLESDYQLVEIDANILNVDVDYRANTFTLSAHIPYDSCGTIKGDLQLRNYISRFDQPMIQSKMVSEEIIPDAQLRKLKAVVVTKQKTGLDRPQNTSNLDEPICAAVVMPITKTFKFSEFGITENNGILLYNQDRLVGEVIDEDKVEPRKVLSNVLTASLSRDATVLMVGFGASDINPQLGDISCELIHHLPQEEVRGKSIYPGESICRAEFLSDEIRKTIDKGGVTTAPITPEDQGLNIKKFTAKNLGLRNFGDSITIVHSTGLIQLTLVANGKMKIAQAFHVN